MVLDIRGNCSYSIQEKDEVLSNVGLLVESCKHDILLELTSVKQIWNLLRDSIFIVSVSRQGKKLRALIYFSI